MSAFQPHSRSLSRTKRAVLWSAGVPATWGSSVSVRSRARAFSGVGTFAATPRPTPVRPRGRGRTRAACGAAHLAQTPRPTRSTKGHGEERSAKGETSPHKNGPHAGQALDRTTGRGQTRGMGRRGWDVARIRRLGGRIQTPSPRFPALSPAAPERPDPATPGSTARETRTSCSCCHWFSAGWRRPPNPFRRAPPTTWPASRGSGKGVHPVATRAPADDRDGRVRRRVGRAGRGRFTCSRPGRGRFARWRSSPPRRRPTPGGPPGSG